MRTVSSREVYRNRWMTVREDEVELDDGQRGIYGVVDKTDFALVVPVDTGGVWMVEQHRYPVGERCWEFPQGTWGEGRSGSPEQLARAELAEETGLRAVRLEHLGRLNSAHGFCSQRYDVWAATGLTQGETDREPSEADMVHRFVPDAELAGWIRDGQLADSHSLAAWALVQARR